MGKGSMGAAAEKGGERPSWEAIRRYLEGKRRPVEDQIRRYPPPIAGCDAHFNYLLEQRTALSRELVRLEQAERAAAGQPDAAAAIDDFLRSSVCIDPGAAEEIRAGASEAR